MWTEVAAQLLPLYTRAKRAGAQPVVTHHMPDSQESVRPFGSGSEWSGTAEAVTAESHSVSRDASRARLPHSQGPPHMAATRATHAADAAGSRRAQPSRASRPAERMTPTGVARTPSSREGRQGARLARPDNMSAPARAAPGARPVRSSSMGVVAAPAATAAASARPTVPRSDVRVATRAERLRAYTQYGLGRAAAPAEKAASAPPACAAASGAADRRPLQDTR
jgi:hypothetical protein